MAKLYFYYAAMNAGKSTLLLQSAHNYAERGMRPLILTPLVDDRDGAGQVGSRIGLSKPAVPFSHVENLHDLVRREHDSKPVHCVLVDEAQFLTRDQVYQLGEVVDRLDIPVLAYGLRTDFQGQLFEGSQNLLAWADHLHEVKTICHCGRKANMVLRLDSHGRPVRSGEQIRIGGDNLYVSVCRLHFKEGLAHRQEDESLFHTRGAGGR